MGIKWKDFQMPKRLECDEATYTPTYGKFIAEPFERGYGVTLGNALRRILLSSIEGSAASGIKIEGVMHEFSTVRGVLEDVTQIVLNVKNLILRSHSKSSKIVTINTGKRGPVQAKDIITDETIEILNPEQHIATITDNNKFQMEIEVSRGRGYVPAEQNKKEGTPIGFIAIDSIFTPVIKVNFKAEDTRVGQKTDYDRLLLEVWTNGSVSPKDAMLYSANILQRHLDVFVNFGQLPEEEEAEEMTEEERALYEKLKMPVSELELSVRSSNCLREAKIGTIADLVKRSEQEMLGFRNFGKKSLNEISDILKEMGLSFGMQIDTNKLKKES